MSHPVLRRQTLTDQVAEILSEGLRAGRWKDRLPGSRKLAEELEVNRKTVIAAVARLTDRGVLTRKKDRAQEGFFITRSTISNKAGGRELHLALLLMRPMETELPSEQREMLDLVSRLKSAGHTCEIVTLPSGKDTHKTGYLARLIAKTGADAWIVYTGTLEILSWFVARRLPAFAIGGRCLTLDIAQAGNDVPAGARAIVRRLTALGHRRIVLIATDQYRKPTPGRIVSAFRDELATAGVKPGEYHTPDWEESPKGLRRLLDSLFLVTPPTALFCFNLNTTHGVMTFLKEKGLRIPEDVSVISVDDDPSLQWLFPDTRIAHLADTPGFTRRHVSAWVARLASGRRDTRRIVKICPLDEGDTLGPAKRE